jgi:hypothetical protein
MKKKVLPINIFNLDKQNKKKVATANKNKDLDNEIIPFTWFKKTIK